MTLYDELDLLEQAQVDAEQVASEMGFSSDVDRRRFVFMSLAAAAATTFGFGATALAQGARRGGGGGGQPGAQQGGPPVPLDNMEAPSWTFEPYPGGTGALLEKTYRAKGLAAFNRQAFAYSAATAPKGSFVVAPFTGALPATDEEIAFLPAHRLSAAIKAGKLTSTRITKIYLERLKRLNPTLFCAVTILEDQALKDAAAMDAELKAGKYRGPLHGLPWGVKDLFAVKGAPTTWGSSDFENREFDFDAEVVTRIRNAGGVLVAKLATGQFATGANWFRGMTRNPWNTSQGSGGSSAGPGSATAAGCVAFGIGTETSGSIVSPATTCGLSALRPTFGRVSRYGGMVLAWSQDRVGPLTRTAQDAAMVFNVIHGADEKDNGTITMPFHFDANINLAGLRIGVRKQQNADANFDAFVAKLKALGARPTDIGEPPEIAGFSGGMGVEYAAAFDAYVERKAKELNLTMDQLTTAYGQAGAGGPPPAGVPATAGIPGGGRGGEPAGIPANNAQFNRWIPGRLPTAMTFLQAQRRRQMLITAWKDYLKDYDLYVGAADTGTHAQTGHPVAVVQMAFGVRQGFGGRGGRGGEAPAQPAAPLNPQPICTQIAGNLYNDDIVLSVAHKYQVNTDFHTHRPDLA